jgi:2,4-diketo-3-deoxy-L-fuconate hydrolase
MKALNSLCGPNDDVEKPRGSTKLDWEVELAIVIGDGGLHRREGCDGGDVAGFCVCNDVSEREFQTERGGQWAKGKGCPTFGPLGPWLVTADEIADVQNLAMWLDVDGEACPERLDQDDDLRRGLSGALYQPVHAARSG